MIGEESNNPVETSGFIEGVEYEVIESESKKSVAKEVSSRAADGIVSETYNAHALQSFITNGTQGKAALEVAILGWLDAKRGRSGSLRTWRTYADVIAHFRAALQKEGLDLDGPSTPVALIAQAWAGARMAEPIEVPIDKAASPPKGKSKNKGVAPTTYNQRLASVSSFYKYARKQGILHDNPIDRVERRRVQAYSGSRALQADYVKRSLALIDRTTPIGARDYALLLTYLQTGRRLSEVAELECRDLEQVPGGKLRVTFRRCKGGKVLYDTLTSQVSAAILTYLFNSYGSYLSDLQQNAPVWISLAERNGTRGGRLSKVSIARICKARLGTPRVHSLRSTMAQVMEKTGAPVSLIQQRLAHSSLATTGIYLASLRQDDNPYADEITGAFLED